MAANNILKIKTTREIPDYLYKLDKQRYQERWNKILKIEKAKKEEEEKKKKKKRGSGKKRKNKLKIKNA